MTIVQVKNLRKTYPLGKVLVEAVKGINFSIDSGEFVSISGPSGSGKSTTLNMIGLIDTPTSGELIINGETILNTSVTSCHIVRTITTVQIEMSLYFKPSDFFFIFVLIPF